MTDRLRPAADQPPPRPVVRPAGPPGRHRRAPLECSPAQRKLEVLIRARYPLLYVVSWEEERVEQQLARSPGAQQAVLRLDLHARHRQARRRAAAGQERAPAPPIRWPRSTPSSIRSSRQSTCSKIFIPSWRRIAAT